MKSMGVTGYDASSFDPCPDDADRMAALDPTGSFIVQAPAGSGKTGLLIQRFLKLLSQVRRPESIVALTFTRKAAAEMRHRVVVALEAASGGAPRDDQEHRTRELATEVLRQDETLGWRLRENPNRLRIQTIDALCARLVGQMPWVSRMGALPETGERVRYLYLRAVRNMLSALDPDGPTDHPRTRALSMLLAHLDNDVAAAERLMAGMLEKRDQWLRHVVRARAAPDARADFERVLEEIVSSQLEAVARSFPPDAVGPAVRSARFAASVLRELDIDSPLAACEGLEGLPAPDSDGLSGWLGLRELFLTRQGRRRRSLDKRQGFLPTPEGRLRKSDALAISLPEECLARLDGTALLPPPAYSEAGWQALSALLDLLPAAVAHLRLVFRREGRVDFTEVAQAARSALGTEEEPTSLAFSLDGHIQHLLVDEFQDTSQSQYALLEALTSDWQDGDGRTLFLVGDPMQSIYAFRDADVALFLRARLEGLGQVRLRALTLTTNFRSSPAIVDWVNRGIGPCFSGREDLLTGAVSFAPSVAHAAEGIGNEDEVQLHPFVGDDPAAEAARVVQIVRRSRATEPWGSIAVLVSARSHLDEIVPAFRREGIRFSARDIDPLSTRPVVGDLVSLTRALTDPADRLSWLAVLRAPWCGLTLADLSALASRDHVSTLWDLIAACPEASSRPPSPLAPDSGVSEDGRRRLARVREVLENAFQMRGRIPLRRWVEGTWVALGGPAVLRTPGELDDVRVWLDLLEEAAPGAWIRDEARFREAIDGLFASPKTDDVPGQGPPPVELLTIHRAKGLEFDTVVLAGLGRVTRSDPPALLSWLEYADRHGVSRLLLAPIREAGVQEDALTRYLGSIEAARRDQETTRLLYVGATRARRQLHILGHTRPVEGQPGGKPNARSLLARIWPAVERGFSEARPASSGRAGAGPRGSHDALRRLSRDWSMPARPVPVSRQIDTPAADSELGRHPTFDWATDLQRRVGIVVHAMLQRISLTGARDARWREESIRAALASEGVGPDRLEEAASRIASALHQTLEDPRGRWILGEHQDDAREYAVGCVRSGRPRRYVLDRTFLEGGVRWIIDYKTGVHAGSDVESFLDNEQARYRGQLEEYARAMSDLDGRPVRLGLYFPLLGGWRSWAFEPVESAHPTGGPL